MQTSAATKAGSTIDDRRIDAEAANAALEPLGALERIRWTVDALGDDVVLLSSMQKTAIVLMHLFHRLGLSNEVLFVDTGYHFVETFEPFGADPTLPDKPEARPTTDVSDRFGFELKSLTKLRHDISLRKRRCAST